MNNLDSILKSRDITLPPKVHVLKAMVFPVVMYGCESWTIKKVAHRRIDAFERFVLEKTLQSPLDCKEIQPVHSKGYQSWVFFRRTDAKAETPVFWPPHVKSWLIGKHSDAGRDWGHEEKVTTEDEMAGWHHQLNGHEFGWTLEDGDGQGGLACCNSWSLKESDTTEQLSWTKLLWMFFSCQVVFSSPAMTWTLAARLLCPWDFPGKNARVGCHYILQGIFSIQGSSVPAESLPLIYHGSPNYCE